MRQKMHRTTQFHKAIVLPGKMDAESDILAAIMPQVQPFPEVCEVLQNDDRLSTALSISIQVGSRQIVESAACLVTAGV